MDGGTRQAGQGRRRPLPRIAALAAALIVLLTAALHPLSAMAQGWRPPEHNVPPPLLDRAAEIELRQLADMGLQLERDRGPAATLAEHRRLAGALATLAPERRGQTDVYILVAALDSDAVFGREAREAAAVLSRRYRANGRTILLAGSDGREESRHPIASPAAIEAALARIAEVMNPAEDVLVLYTTSHGAPFGIVYNDGNQGYGLISPARLWNTLSTLGIRNRLLMISACFSGIFVPMLSSSTTAIVTAAAADRPSFGCQADSDWTFFGDALVNQALRKPRPLAAAADEAVAMIAGWESGAGLPPSGPQVSIGPGARRWLAAIERDLPAASAPVGQPAITALERLAQRHR